MSPRIEFENIEEMRREAGIDDVELREEIRGLRAGDSVRLTARVGKEACPRDCVLVRITSVKGRLFRGKLTQGPAHLPQLKAGALLTFTGDHIHSVASKRPAGRR